MSDTCEMELPTSEAVARALVAAARKLGEDPLRAFEASLRCRYVAGHALKIIYPAVSWVAIGRMVGIVGVSPATLFAQVKKVAWWAADGEAGVEAALEALETL